MTTPKLSDQGHEHGVGLAPLSEVEIVDDWYTTGPRGAGSKSMVRRDLHIPEYRTTCSKTCRGSATPDGTANPDPIDRMKLFSLLRNGIVAPAVGLARGALGTTKHGIEAPRIEFDNFVIDKNMPRPCIGVAKPKNYTARTQLGLDRSEIHDWTDADEVPTHEERHRWRHNDALTRDMAYLSGTTGHYHGLEAFPTVWPNR